MKSRNLQKHSRVLRPILTICASLFFACAVEAQIKLSETYRLLAQDRDLQPPTEASQLFPSYDPHHPPPANAPAAFALSQDYPVSFRGDETFPWSAIDVTTHPVEYLRAVLGYCIEGNPEVDFVVQNNAIRKWFHTPWLHDDGEPNGAGREYLRGLTRERRSREFELHTLQRDRAQNWAIGFYSDRGGVTVGKVWRTATGYPDPTQSTFPPNTVTFKLLFTDAPTEQVPFLNGTLEWRAHVYADTNYQPPRVEKTMRLLQIDVAVKEPRVASQSGWVFGTFIYDASAPGQSVWDKMIPVGASWGDDSTERSFINRDGVFVNTNIKQSRINSFLVERVGLEYGAHAYVRHHGLGGRLNGPVDNPVSSCISCHGRAATFRDALPFNERSGLPMPFAFLNARKPSEFPEAQFDPFFRSIPGYSHVQEADALHFVTTDYSLQLSAGIRNFYQGLRGQGPLLDRLNAAHLLNVDRARVPGLPKLPRVTREID